MQTQNLDKAQFETLFREYFPSLCSFAKKYVNDADEAKDIIHNVFVSLWQKRDEIETDVSLKSYLFKSVHNRCLNYIRDQKKLVHHDLPLEQTELDGYIESGDVLEQSELEARINRAIDSLPEGCRKVFILNRFEEKKYKEIAELLNISVKTVEAQMSKALRILRADLGDYLVLLICMFFYHN